MPPTLVFKPDARQTARIARIRSFTLLATVGLMIVALVLILSYRPPLKPISTESPKSTGYAPDTTSQPVPPMEREPVSAPRKYLPGDITRSAVAAIDSLVGAASEKWRRAAELSPQVAVTRDNAQAADDDLRKAMSLGDSARKDISVARQQSEVVLNAARRAESNAGFRLSVLYSAIDRYLKSLEDDAEDRRAFLAKSEQSVQAVLQGDQPESEIQQNVAMSYFRKSEDRQAGIRRLGDQMREALRGIDNVGR